MMSELKNGDGNYEINSLCVMNILVSLLFEFAVWITYFMKQRG